MFLCACLNIILREIYYHFQIFLGYGFKDEKSMTKEEIIVFYHRLAEAFKHAYAKRTFFGDENFVDLKSVSLKCLA